MLKIICGKIINTDNYDKNIPEQLKPISAEINKDNDKKTNDEQVLLELEER